jgi:hypothetical protein
MEPPARASRFEGKRARSISGTELAEYGRVGSDV